METLAEMPNIGTVLEKMLRQANINSPAELKETGSKSAFLQIRAFNADACFCKLCALEGAIRGIRWHNLPSDVKADLQLFFSLKNT